MDWQPVILAADCPPCDCCGQSFCVTCQTHYPDCTCPGPHQDDLFEYRTIDGQLLARRIA